MSRSRMFSVSGINIRVHTKHEASEYLALWEKLHASRKYATYASNALMIGDVRYEAKGDPEGRLYGYLYRFLDVDPDDPWFDIVRHKRATEDAIQAVNIPDELKPNLIEIPYVFDVKRHQLYFVSSEADVKISPRFVMKLLTRLCKTDPIIERFGAVDLTILTDKKKVAELLSWPVIRSLTIKIDRPNPTEEEDEAAFYERLRQRGLATETRTYKKAEEAQTIRPDDEMKALADIAANNGVVKVSGKNRKQQTDKASSINFPLTLKGSYLANVQTLLDGLKTLVDTVRR